MKHNISIETGLSILFCCYQCIVTNISADKLDDDKSIENSSISGTGRLIRNSFPHQGYLEKPGKDYPVLARIPETTFTCLNLETGYYADLETRCQVFHICEDGKKMSFLCPNGTIFQQSELICDWWFKVNCTVSPLLYEESSEQLREASLRRKLARRTPLKNNIIRMPFKKKETVTTKYSEISRRNFEVEHVTPSMLNSYPTTAEFISTRRRLSTSQIRERKPSTQKPSRSRVTSRRVHKNSKNHTLQNIQTLDKPIENYEETKSTLPSNSRNSVGKINIKVSNTIRNKKLNEINQLSNNSSNDEKTFRDENNFVNIFVNSKHKILKPNKTNKPRSRTNSCQYCTNNRNYKTVLSTTASTADQKPPKQFEESQITQESSNNFNSPIHPNHRTTYNEIKEPNYSNNKYSSRIIPVTSQYLTTQSFNTGKIFVGSSVGKMIPRNELTNGEANSKNKSNLGEENLKQPQRQQNTSITADEIKKNNTSSIVTNDTIPLSVEDINSSLLNISDSSPLDKIQLNDNSEVIYEKERDDATNGFVRFANGFQQNLPSKTTRNYFNQNNAVIKSTKQDLSTYSTEGTVSSSEDNLLDSIHTRTLVPSKPPRPFGRVGTEPATIEAVPNEITNSQDSSLPYPFFRISTASPFSLPKRNEEHYQFGSSFTDMSEPVTETIDIQETHHSLHNHGHEVEPMLRSGLVVPPSVSPRVIHSLAAYFENSMDTLNKNKKIYPNDHNETMTAALEDHLKSLLSNMTRDGYEKLFMENGFMDDIKPMNLTASTENEEDNTDNADNSEDVRKLAKIFSHALSQYLDDPSKFRKALVNIRPTEPPNTENLFPYESELLNFSEDDPKVISPFMLNNTSSNEKIKELDEIQNSLPSDSESLSIADSQSFISQFNSLNDVDKKNALKKKGLPNDHWTTSFEATKLWRTTFAVDPYSLNKDFQGTESYAALNPSSANYETTENVSPTSDGILPIPEEEIKYELRSLPKLTFNSTQVDGISIDFKNKDPLSENKFQNILNKLNITKDDFMDKMKELEGNPITRRLVLFLIQKCDLEMHPKPSPLPLAHPTQATNSAITANQKKEDTRALTVVKFVV
ncbi:hypothetical protein WA026_010124 [Henosepilachna vigintioctopunctata]|uniref:Chitin-binding type-2 domain-containing protein n=1 Tax=Henosepilachna vigintioctopunctata TaxID=420089 RepID=A0AAW1UIB1_9CUCU